MHFLKSKLFKKGLYSVVVASVVGLIAACGGTNNDQGVSFTLLGFYADTEGSTGVSAYNLSRSALISESTQRTILGLQNNLEGEFIRLRRANYSYEIPGTTLPLPNYQSALGGIVGPTVISDGGTGVGGGAGDTFDSSLPEGFATNPVGNILYTTVGLISPQFSKYLRDNQGALPETPFEVIATVYVTGVTSAGDVIESNAESMLIRVLGDDSIEFFTEPSPTATTTEADLDAENEEQLEELF